MKYINKLLVFSLFVIFFPSGAFATQCIGPADSSRFVVYLHGWDTTEPGQLEKNNRAILETIGEKLKIRFALPRSTIPCPSNPNFLCWTWTDQDSIQPVVDSVNNAANSCFPNQEFSILGFSNGGFAVNKIMRKCIQGNYTHLISFSAGSEWSSSDVQKMENCNLNLSINVGQSDTYNLGPALDFYNHLLSLNAQTSYSTYSGGHELTFNALMNALK